ncbi:MAG TPA: cyclic nucleotide-binding domain-containing protein [Gaiellaceae bacterium]|nr:cyclic nucleotide-binding domain-containing protein [Gaiellaceae bacterium]
MSVDTDLAATLAGLRLFSDLDRPELEEIAHTFDEEVIPAGQRVLRQGLSGSNVYVILEGEAGLVLNGEERASLQRGEFFGEVSILLGESPTSDIVAKTTLRCLVIPGPQLRGFLLAHPEVMLQMLLSVTWRLRTTLAWLS